MDELLKAVSDLHSEFTVTSGSHWLPEWTSHHSMNTFQDPNA